MDLSQTSILSFEIGDDCNLKKCHDKCPINYRKYVNDKKSIDVDLIVKSIKEAQDLNFNGYIAFHNYNEPLLHKNKLLEVIKRTRNGKFLLWTNGLLLDRNDMKKNEFLKKFNLICITCYDEKDRSFFEQIKQWHGAVEIYDWELDDRQDAYIRDYHNEIGCKRPLFELPIDFHGNVHLCCFDWNTTFEIGNITQNTLTEIVNSDVYQKLLKDTKHKLLNVDDCPEICKRCNVPWLRYTHYYDIYTG